MASVPYGKPYKRLNRSMKGANREAVRLAHRFASWYRRTLRPLDRIAVCVVPGSIIEVRDPKGNEPAVRAYAAFQWQFKKDAAPMTCDVLIAGGLMRLSGRRQFISILAHEFAHYEQWRGGRRPHEGGATRRGNGLAAMYYGEKT